MSPPPLVSVVMSVYNAEDTVAKAIESICSQHFQDFEFIIIDDGSIDGTAEVLSAYAQKDPRILIKPQKNAGLTVSLNRGIAVASGKYIARQDSDDISMPSRLDQQISLMELDPEIVLCGASCVDLYPNGDRRVWRAQDPESISRTIFLKTPFAHSTAIMRTDICRRLGGYDESYRTAQDTELWMRFSAEGKIAMIDEVLLERQILPSSISMKKRWRQFYDSLRARWTHNQGFLNKARAVYYSLRILLISFIPPGLLRLMRPARFK